MSSIKDGLRVIALERHVEELRGQVDMLVQRQNELEEAWREAARPRGAAVDRNGSPPSPMQADLAVKKVQGRY